MERVLITAESAPPRRLFIVSQNGQGGWSARERHGLIERVFPTRREAIHFALFQTGTPRAAVSLMPGG